MKLTDIIIAASLMAVPSLISAASKVEWRSSVENNYWTGEKSPSWSATPADGAGILTVSADRAQEIEGLGGTFNEIGWDALCALDAADRDRVINDLFSPTESNYTYCRMPIGASDYGMNFYSLNDVADDFEMVNFSIARDRHILMRYIKEAMKVHPGLKIWASPWSPPAWMKTNNHYASGWDWSENNHNGLPKERELELPTTGFKMQNGYLKAYALYFAKFVKAYEKEGIRIEAVNVQNEPCSNHIFPSCVWRPEDLAYFIGHFLGPKFEEEGIDTEIFFGTINRDNPAYTRAALDYAPAAKYIKGAGFQWDGKGAIPYINVEYPSIKVMHTEAECGNGSNDWAAAEHTWWQMRHYLTNGSRTFIYWNMVLDHEGISPWGWKQNALISVNKEEKTVKYNPEFYLMKHLCRFVNPGAHRLLTEGDDLLAFVNPDGSRAVMIVNRDNEAKKVSLKVDDRYLNITLKPKSFNTFNI
ncbi:MAG: glycosyl hydrolase family 30 [Duncaniella sp.]|nr:glycosyl hydrolase family 30 [Duncaniella sp.]